MSTSLCLMAWNEAMGRPKATVLAGHVEGGLGAAHLFEGDEDGGAVEDALGQRPAFAGRAEGSTAAPSKMRWACERVGSIVATLVRVTPAACRSTRKSAAASSGLGRRGAEADLACRPPPATRWM
jgi:hypothetical protein